jgi:hypothetical protein
VYNNDGLDRDSAPVLLARRNSTRYLDELCHPRKFSLPDGADSLPCCLRFQMVQLKKADYDRRDPTLISRLDC